MAKITSIKVENPSTAELYTLTTLQKGDKIAFLPLDWGGIVAHSDDNRHYIQAIPVIVVSATGATFISRISGNTFTARAANGEAYPQIAHTVSKKIAYCGTSAVEELAEKCQLVDVVETYDICCKYLKKEGTYNWTTLGLELSSEVYTIDADSIHIGAEVYTRKQVQKYLQNYAEKRSTQLAE